MLACLVLLADILYVLLADMLAGRLSQLFIQREQEQAEMIQAAEAAEADQVHWYRDPPL